MGEEWSTPFLRNRYWILRHGRSIPNERGLIVSSLENGVLTEFELASEGVKQAQLAGEQFLKELEANNILLEDVRICYSPFSRTTHTAKVVASVLNIPFVGPQCKVIKELRERFFGPTFELLSHDKLSCQLLTEVGCECAIQEYAEIWAHDENDPFKPPEGGECVADVVSRLATALTGIETEFQGCAILVVSHGDPLQIFQTIIHAVKEQMGSHGAESDLLSEIKGVTVPEILSRHRRFALLTGELRRVV